MATKKGRSRARGGAAASRARGASAGTRASDASATRTSSPVDEMLLAALERGDDSFETGRFLVTFKEGAAKAGLESLGMQGMRVADARDFTDQAASLESVGDADAVVFSEIGAALVGGGAAQERSMSANAEIAADSPVESIDPELFVFAEGGTAQTPESARGGSLTSFAQTTHDRPGEFFGSSAQAAESSNPGEYLRGFIRAAEVIARDLGESGQAQMEAAGEEALVLGATWGLIACKVPPSPRSGAGIKVAVLGTGMDLGHPDFAGRIIVSQTFVGQPVHDLNGHETHLIGTACGPKTPPGNIPRYGIGYRTSIFVGKVLTNSGTGTQGGILAGMNWAIANRCPVILATFASSSSPQPIYTALGQAALNNGCLIIAPAGSSASQTGAPANSPTIMAVASLEKNLSPSSFSSFGKIDIAAPGRDIFSSAPRPVLYRTLSGVASASAHVAGCAALWAQTSPNLRGMALWNRLRASARPLPFPPTRVGAGLVQAP